VTNPVESIIREYGANPKAAFVFPSDVAAALWREEALEILGVGTIEARRFIAWDRFKAEAIRSTVGDRRPVSAPVRGLYARDLARRNAESEPPLFKTLIPSAYAAEGASFAAWISRLLPQLALWEDKRAKAREMPLFPVPEDGEDGDLAFLKADYAEFLARHRLFEPSWERPPLKETGFFYIILFFEAIEDWNEFAPALGKAPFVKIVPALDPDAERPIPVAEVYATARDEIKACALAIEGLIARGARADRVAVSVPDLETLAPYLTREFALRGIPYEYRAGEPLGGRSAGRIFRLLDACVGQDFSFAAMKALLLDRLVPWSHPELAERLVAFGIANRCVTAWTDGGKRMDPWEEAFREPVRFSGPDEGLRTWYRELRKALVSLAASDTFSEIRSRWFAFRNRFFDMDRLDPADDAVLARCVEELNALAALEAEYADVMREGAWPFFLDALERTTYVRQRAAGGVNLFPWRVAAGTPFPWHFALDASQDRATVLYRQLSFLREDKREALRSQELDATSAFFGIYAACPRESDVPGLPGGMRFSVAERSFKGYTTPHNALATRLVLSNGGRSADSVSGASILSDPFRDELALAEGTGEPDRLYPVQIEGHGSAIARRRTPNDSRFSYLRAAYDPGFSPLSARVRDRQYTEGAVRVSQTDLATHATCPARWFLGKILAIEPPAPDAELMNDRRLGIVYHEVFKRVYGRIRDEDGPFRSARLDEYRAWAAECAENAAAESDEFKGPLAAPVLSTLVSRIAGGVSAMLAQDAAYLDGFIPDFLEEDISFAREGIRYYGKIDRISRRAADGKLVLIDYKTGKTPPLDSYRTDLPDRPGAIADFQMPTYIFLAETSPSSPYRGERIECAWFASVREERFSTVVSDGEEGSPKAKRGTFDRDGFAGAIDAFEESARSFAVSVQNLDFRRPEGLSRAECARCDYRGICRWNYSVGAP